MKAKKLLLIPLLLSALVGCTTNMPKEVAIPVIAQPHCPQIPAKPILPIAKLTKGSTPSEVVKAYAISINKLQQDDDNLRTLLQGCACDGGAN